MAYNLETVLAEKIETILSRGEANTRPRDFYDCYVLFKMRKQQISNEILKSAMFETSQKRGTKWIVEDADPAYATIESSDVLRNRWERYSKRYEYAKGISYSDVLKALKELIDIIK